MRGIICDQALQAQVHDNTLQNIPQGMLTLQQGFGNQYFCNYLEGFMTGMYFDGASIDPQGVLRITPQITSGTMQMGFIGLTGSWIRTYLLIGISMFLPARCIIQIHTVLRS